MAAIEQKCVLRSALDDYSDSVNFGVSIDQPNNGC